MASPVVSVIIPVYNLKQYLPFSVASVRRQSFSDIEIILVDDGSVDGSAAICDELATQDKRIRAIHQANSGVSAARNTGIAAAKGTFLAFVDGDDWIVPDYLERLMSEMTEGTVLSMCGHVRLTAHEQPFPAASGVTHHYSAKECALKLLRGRFPISACCCVLRKDRLDQNRFPVGVRNNEDKLFLYRYLLDSEEGMVAFTNDPLYGYFVREGSATKKAWNGSEDVIRVADEIEKLTLEHHAEWREEAKNNAIAARFTALKSIILSDSGTNEGAQAIRRIRREIMDRGWPKTAGHRTRVEYISLLAGTWCYRLLVKMFYGMTSDERRYRTNEERIRQE